MATHHRGRRRKHRPTAHAPGMSPGTIVADPTSPRPVIDVLAYGPDGFVEQAITDPKALPALQSRWPVMWVNVAGLGDATTIEELGQVFHLHRLALEDVTSTAQRPKIETYQSGYFIVARMLDVNPEWDNEQISLFVGDGFVLMFQERPGDCFEPVRDRIRQGRGRIRQMGADYLAYALLDATIDRYFPVMDELEDRLDRLEESILAQADKTAGARIYQIKQEAIGMRRLVAPLKEAIYQLLRDDNPLLSDETRTHLRDCHDHVSTIIDRVESFRENALGLMDVYHASFTSRLNEIMTVLTIIATIFIPLSFIASIYGMNFSPDAGPLNMPELRWRYGYLFALGLMAAVTLGLLGYFWASGWIGSHKRPASTAEKTKENRQ